MGRNTDGNFKFTALTGFRAMAAYGLYTHIAANKTRSMLLLGGLFVLVYVMVYAGALIAEVLTYGAGAPADFYLAAAARDLIKAFPFATGGALLWIAIAYFFHQKIVDAVTGGGGGAGRLLRRAVFPQLHQFRLLRRRLWPGLVVVFVLGRIFLLVGQQERLRRRRHHRHHRRRRVDRAGVAVVADGAAGAVALARISRRRRLGRTDQESGRHDFS